ncbi:hypothetical protein GF327_00875 [Candidatus Woesearchaeota archaeon]|nr:hypothetical protein [Candidatus Woesearchaeota archaeon]
MKYLIESLMTAVAAQAICSFLIRLEKKLRKVRFKSEKNEYLTWRNYLILKQMNRID